MTSAPLSRLPGPLVVTQIPVGSGLAGQATPSGGALRAPSGEGARLLLVSPDGSARVLTAGLHSACDPDVSFDARRILFAAKRAAADPWSICEMAADGSAVRPVTKEPGDCRSPGYQSALFTLDAPAPWRQITFVGDAAGTLNEHDAARATHLYSCKLDGSDVRRLTYGLSSAADPFLMADGRLLFASGHRNAPIRGLQGRSGLFGVNIDGTDYALFAATDGRHIQRMPCVTSDGLAVFVEADEAQWDAAGSLACVSLRRPLHSYRPLTRPAAGLFHSPSPLPDGSLLVSRRPRDGSGTHGVYRLVPRTGELQRVFDDLGYHDVQAKLIHPRPEPDGRSTVVNEEDPRGKLYCLNVYASDLAKREWMPPGTVRRLRILEGVPPRAPDRGGSLPANGLPLVAERRFLGEIDVRADGSFNVEVPANTPIELQILDADGLALRSCGWIWARNHEPRGCIGCHEDGELTPENHFSGALDGPSVSLCPPEPQRRAVDFSRDLLPVIQGKCMPCHGQSGAKPRLDAGAHFTYEALLARSEYVHPGSARTSPLIWHVFGRNTARGWDGPAAARRAKPIPPGQAKPLSEGERRAFAEWVDLGAQR